jgi:ATP-dependent DNA ligase
VDLPIAPPIDPMLAKLARELPLGDLLYEPKWDGFRCLVFRDGDDLLLQSRNGKPLDRYFPELVDPTGPDPLRRLLPDRIVLDGELVVPAGEGLDFDALSNRVHPAASRVERLAADTPARYVAFDLLALGDVDLRERAFDDRRHLLTEALSLAEPPVHLTPATTDARVAADWFTRFEGAGLDGVMAKPLGEPYAAGKRALFKVKQQRTADCVVAGFRWHKDAAGVGSLLLGLYDDTGTLVNVGVASSFSAARRAELVDELAAHRVPDGEVSDHPWLAGDGTASTPRGQHRWSGGRDTSWELLRLGLVAEVAYEQLQGDRFRHSARFRRWRPDRDPESCRFDQLEVPPPAELTDLFAIGS